MGRVGWVGWMGRVEGGGGGYEGGCGPGSTLELP